VTKDTPLSRKIETLVSQDTFDGKALVLGPSAEPDSVTHVLQAIDDTMMLRNAVFAVGESVVTLRISGKRLLKVVAATPDLEAPDDLIDQQLSADTSEALDHLADLLITLVAKPGTLTLERQPAEAAAKPSGSGVGISALNAILADKKKSELQNATATFLTTCTSLATALVERIGGEENVISGDQSKIVELENDYGKKWAKTAANGGLSNSISGGGFLRIVEVSDSSDLAFSEIIIDEKQYLMLMKVRDVALLSMAWAKVINVT